VLEGDDERELDRLPGGMTGTTVNLTMGSLDDGARAGYAIPARRGTIS
jgi:hypothetical protein